MLNQHSDLLSLPDQLPVNDLSGVFELCQCKVYGSEASLTLLLILVKGLVKKSSVLYVIQFIGYFHPCAPNFVVHYIKLLFFLYATINRRSQRSTDFVFNVEHLYEDALVFILQSNAPFPNVLQILLLKLVDLLDFSALIDLLQNVLLVPVQKGQDLGDVAVVHVTVDLLQLFVQVSKAEFLSGYWIGQQRGGLGRSHLIARVRGKLRSRLKHRRWIWIQVPHLILIYFILQFSIFHPSCSDVVHTICPLLMQKTFILNDRPLQIQIKHEIQFIQC